MAKSVMGANERPPVVSLYRTESQIELINFFLRSQPDEYYRKTELAEVTDNSTNAVQRALGSNPEPRVLVDMGIVERKDPDAPMPRYKRADSPTMTFLSNYHGYPLDRLFRGIVTQKLTEFFLAFADPTEKYAPNWFERNAENLCEQAINQQNIQPLIRSGLISKTTDGKATRYSLRIHSDIYKTLVALDTILFDAAAETPGPPPWNRATN
jgi:hypothetical protein